MKYTNPAPTIFSLSDILIYVIILVAAILILVVLLVVLRIRKSKLDLDDVSDLEREASRARKDMEEQRGQLSSSPSQKHSGAHSASNGRASTYAVNIPPVRLRRQFHRSAPHSRRSFRKMSPYPF